MGIRPFQGISPILGLRVYLDAAATVIGDVVLGDDVSIWPGTVAQRRQFHPGRRAQRHGQQHYSCHPRRTVRQTGAGC
jgi:carbonic anhydrase/acetyltransferase-like protein (isoleucine patch superfamily)